MNNNIIVFDLEIRKSVVDPIDFRDEETEVSGWGNSYKAGISCTVMYDYQADTYRVYGENQTCDLIARMNSADFIVGYNHINFDYKVVDYIDKSRVNDPSKDIDLLQEIMKQTNNLRKGSSLDKIAEATLGRGKSGDGAFAPVLYQEGRWCELIDYCIQDVERTKKLFDHVLKNGFVMKGSQKISMTSVQDKVLKQKQQTLF